jgi:hypothetical protein
MTITGEIWVTLDRNDSFSRKLDELFRRRRQAERAWRDLARRTKQDVGLICLTVRALEHYLDCLDRYRWHQALSQQAEG